MRIAASNIERVLYFPMTAVTKKFSFTVALHVFYVNRQNARKNTIHVQKTNKFCGEGVQPLPNPTSGAVEGNAVTQNIFGECCSPNNIRTRRNGDIVAL